MKLISIITSLFKKPIIKEFSYKESLINLVRSDVGRFSVERVDDSCKWLDYELFDGYEAFSARYYFVDNKTGMKFEFNGEQYRRDKTVNPYGSVRISYPETLGLSSEDARDVAYGIREIYKERDFRIKRINMIRRERENSKIIGKSRLQIIHKLNISSALQEVKS